MANVGLMELNASAANVLCGPGGPICGQLNVFFPGAKSSPFVEKTYSTILPGVNVVHQLVERPFDARATAPPRPEVQRPHGVDLPEVA